MARGSGQVVDVNYQGPPLKPWHASWLWAVVVTNLEACPRDADPATFDATDTFERAMIARSITIAAREVYHLTGEPMATVPSPSVLSPLPLLWLHQHLSHVVRAITDFSKGIGYGPLPGEPGWAVYDQLEQVNTAGGLTPEDLLHNPAAQVRVTSSVDQWGAAQQTAARVIEHAILRTIDQDQDDPPVPPLGVLGGYLNDYLAAHRDPFGQPPWD